MHKDFQTHNQRYKHRTPWRCPTPRDIDPHDGETEEHQLAAVKQRCAEIDLTLGKQKCSAMICFTSIDGIDTAASAGWTRLHPARESGWGAHLAGPHLDIPRTSRSA
eukprot:5538798-Amphidinium_carterae.1